MSQRSHWSAVIFLSCVAVTGCSSESKSDAPGGTGNGNGDPSMQGQPNGNTGAPSGNTSANPAAGTGGSSGSSNPSSGGTQMNNPGAGNGSANNGGAAGAAMMPDDTSIDPKDPKTPFNKLPANCVGFKVEGLKNSPGGSTLPNTCAPFDGWLNNPYAIRCIDADPTFKSGFIGDEYCILPPDPKLGMQVRVGPTSYDDPAATKDFILQPDQEVNTFYYIKSPNDQPVYYYRTNWRMRQGSHHMIITLPTTDQPDGWVGQGAGFDGIGAGGGSNFGGAQRTDVDRPEGTLDVPPENVGLGGQLAAHQQFSFNLHHMDFLKEPILREAWVNIWFMDQKDVTKPMTGISLFGNPADMNIAPGEHQALEYMCSIPEDTRIITLLGHRHASTDRFGVWVIRGGEKTDVYESFDWEDIPTYQYDSISKNPVPNVDMKVDGASSGVLELKAGDELHFLCDVTNHQDQALRFANEVFTGEMCILFGSYTGGKMCSSSTRVQ
jgi:hypothetical protein